MRRLNDSARADLAQSARRPYEVNIVQLDFQHGARAVRDLLLSEAAYNESRSVYCIRQGGRSNFSSVV